MQEELRPEINNVIPIERGLELRKRKAPKLQKQILHRIQSVEVYRNNLQEKMVKAVEKKNGLEEYRLYSQIQHINRHIAVGRVLLEDGSDVRAMAEYLESEWKNSDETQKEGAR